MKAEELKGILQLKLCKVNIHTCTWHFMERQQKDNETLAAYVHLFITAARQCAFDNDIVAIHIFDTSLLMHTPLEVRFMKMSLKL